MKNTILWFTKAVERLRTKFSDESQQRTALKEIIKHFCTYRQRSSRQDLEMVLEYKIGQLKLSGPF